MLKRLSDRLLAFAPLPYRPAMRRVLAVLGIAFVAFEFWRLAVGLTLLPWGRIGAGLAHLAAFPLPIAIVAFGIAALAFIIPMAAVVWALRRLSRIRTVR